MSISPTMKPIQATPELKGKDAIKLLEQVNTLPTQNTLDKNIMLCNVLHSICKQ